MAIIGKQNNSIGVPKRNAPRMDTLPFNDMTVNNISISPGRPDEIQLFAKLHDGRTAEANYHPKNGVWVNEKGRYRRLGRPSELNAILQSLVNQQDVFIRRNPSKKLDYTVLVQQVAKSVTRLLSFVPETTPGSELGFTRLVGPLDSARGIHGWIGYNSKGEFFAKKGRTPQMEEKVDGRSDTIWDEPQQEMSKLQLQEAVCAIEDYVTKNPSKQSQFDAFLTALRNAQKK